MPRYVRVRCAPSGRVAEVPAGTTLFDAVRTTGLPVGASCDAEGVCGACGLRIEDAPEALSRETPFERGLKTRNGVDAAMRISCLARVLDDVTVRATYW